MDAEKFVVDDDKKADWALKRIAEEQEERDRLIKLAKEEIEELKAKIEKVETEYGDHINYFKALLADYFSTVEHKDTKTRETYKLLNGSLVMKKARKEIRHGDEELLNYLLNSGKQEYVKTTLSPMWSEFKKRLEIVDNIVIDTETGEAVDCLTVEDVPEEFTVAV